jgi:hypothetical protein
MLYHFSDQPDIACFEPREIDGSPEPVVWAISAARQCNYLLPRDCPRVTYYAGPTTTAADRQIFLGAATAVVAIETSWQARVQTARIYRYCLPTENFECTDETAGYFVCRQPVKAITMAALDDLPSHIAATGAELRVLPTLWPLHDAVAASTLAFSMIRMRNAQSQQYSSHAPTLAAGQ